MSQQIQMITIREGEISNVDWWKISVYAKQKDKTRSEVISELVTKFVEVKCAHIPSDPAYLPKSSGSFAKGENSIIRKKRKDADEANREHNPAGTDNP